MSPRICLPKITWWNRLGWIKALFLTLATTPLGRPLLRLELKVLRTRQKSFTLAFDRSGPFLIVNYRSLGLSSGIGLVALDPGVQASKRKGGRSWYASAITICSSKGRQRTGCQNTIGKLRVRRVIGAIRQALFLGSMPRARGRVFIGYSAIRVKRSLIHRWFSFAAY